MHKFTLPMLGFQRPIIKLYGSEALIDTGAIIPMTTFSPEILQRAWNAKILIPNTSIGGIGGESKGSVYTLKDFEIGDMHYDKLDIFVPEKADFKYPFLLSSTLFANTNFTFDMANTDNQFFHVEIPEGTSLNRTFEIKNLKGKLCAQIDGILIQEQDDYQHVDNFTQIVTSSKHNRQGIELQYPNSEDSEYQF